MMFPKDHIVGVESSSPPTLSQTEYLGDSDDLQCSQELDLDEESDGNEFDDNNSPFLDKSQYLDDETDQTTNKVGQVDNFEYGIENIVKDKKKDITIFHIQNERFP